MGEALQPNRYGCLAWVCLRPVLSAFGNAHLIHEDLQQHHAGRRRGLHPRTEGAAGEAQRQAVEALCSLVPISLCCLR